MGTFRITIEIGDLAGSRFVPVEALVDTGASHTLMPVSLLRELGTDPHTSGVFRLAAGRQMELSLGRAWVRINGNEEMTLVVFGSEDTEPVLGAVTLEEFRLGVDPVARRLIPVKAC